MVVPRWGLWHSGPRRFQSMSSGKENAAVVACVEAVSSPRPLLSWLIHRLTRRVTVTEEWVEQMGELARKGTIVHVLLKLSLLDFLCLEQLCRDNDLPPIRMVNSAGWYASWPLRWLLRLLWRRCRTCDPAQVSDLAEQGQSSLIFLRNPSWSRQGKSSALAADSTEALLQVQKSLDRPLLLVPHQIIWGRRRPSQTRGLTRWLQRLREGPGLLRYFARVMRSHRSAQIRAAEPLNLRELIEENQDASDDELATQARFALLRRIERDRKLALGPMAKSARTFRDDVMRGAGLDDELRSIAEEKKIPVEKVRRKARRVLREIQATPKSGYLAMLNAVMWWAWSKIFEGVEVDTVGLARLRAKAREGPVILVSSHKSHVDYLIISQVLWENGIFPPHIAAGRNLSFWPLGPIFRGCGAFFIRRHFLGDKLYVSVMQAYLRKIMQEGYNIEFFIEGTRSRSGKVLPPKLGLLTMLVEAVRRLKGYKVTIQPISVTYARVPEEGSHTAELSGSDKKAEDIGGLLRTRHTLSRRHGRLYVQFGAPIDIKEYLQEQEIEEEAPDGSIDKRAIANLAYRSVYEINKASLVTPTALVATALLLNRRRGMTHKSLREAVSVLTRRLVNFDARFSASLAKAASEGTSESALQYATKFLSDVGLVKRYGKGEDVIYTVPPERRPALDYYKNSILHPFVDSALVSAALGLDTTGRESAELAERVRFLSRLLKYEFIFRADAVFEVNLERTVDDMVGEEMLRREDDRVVLTGGKSRGLFRTYGALVENFIESYRIVIRYLRGLGNEEVGEKEFLKQVMALGERMYLVGEIELREARSKVNFKNAIKALRDLEVLDQNQDTKKLSVSERYLKQGRLERLERRLVSYLDR